MARRFEILRAAFFLLAFVIAVEMLSTFITVLGCLYMVVFGGEPVGTCSGVGQQIREVWSEMLSAVLALLLAGRGPPPPPNHPPDPPPEGDTH